MWQPISHTPYDRNLELAVLNHVGEHALVFRVDSWVNALTRKHIDVQPTHWREWKDEQASL
jgi:hypothetical protein